VKTLQEETLEAVSRTVRARESVLLTWEAAELLVDSINVERECVACGDERSEYCDSCGADALIEAAFTLDAVKDWCSDNGYTLTKAKEAVA
jgi:hypothetical protein